MKIDVTTKVKEHAEAIRRGAETLATRVSDWQIIKKFLTQRVGDLKLTDTQQDKLNRYNFMYNQLQTGRYTEHDVVTMVSKNTGISIPMAYEDMACTKELFGTMFNFNKAFELRLQLDLNRVMMAKADEAGDLKSWGVLEKNRISLLAQVKEIDEQENWFEAHENVIEFNPELLGSAPVDINQVLEYINEKRKTKIRTELFDEALTDDKK